MPEPDSSTEITIIVNGAAAQVSADDQATLLDVLRDQVGCTGPKFGCGEGVCGACQVLVGRRAVAACSTPAARVAGERITTVEGLADDGVLHPAQQAWLETGAMQCGYCTPGWLIATAALLAAAPHPDDARIAAELAGHICRCCTYPRIGRAVRRAAELMDHPEQLTEVPPAAAVASAGPATEPPVPWDQGAKDAGSFFGPLPDGLVTVAAAGDDGGPQPGGWGGPGDAWVHVGSDGSITAFTGKVEAGQGTRTALALLVAEELAVPADRVRLVMANTDVSPFDLGTFGSRSMPHAAPPLRAAAAAARDWLVAAAASRFGISAAELTVSGGLVAGPDGAPSIGYGGLLAGVRHVERVPADRPVRPARQWRATGHPARAIGGAAVVTGAKLFPSDISVGGMLHGCVLRPPAYGAVLRSADTAAAAALQGATVVSEPGLTGIVAADRATARRAVGLIDASWDLAPQPASGKLAGYLRAHPIEGAGLNSPFLHCDGDVAAALAAGPVRESAHYSAAYIAHVPLEPRVALASWERGRVTIWVGTSTPFRARREVAAALGLPGSAPGRRPREP